MTGLLGSWTATPVELQAAIVGAVATTATAVVGVMAIIGQLRSQARQSREAIAEAERRRIKAALYEDAVAICRRVSDTAIALSTKLRTMGLELEVAARASPAGMAHAPPSARFLTISALYEAFSEAALAFVFLVEERRIVDARILVFRTAMSVVLHDSRRLMHSDFVVHVMPILPAERPEGGLFPYTTPPMAAVTAATALGDRLIDALGDAGAYAEDFLVEMQNLLLGDLFGGRLDARQPLDPYKRAITLADADQLEAWFRSTTGWGREMARAEDDARLRLQGTSGD